MAKLGYSVLNAANHVACTISLHVLGGVLWNTFAPFAASPVSSHRSLPIGSVLLLSPCLNCRDLVPDSSPPRELCAAYLWTSYVDTQNADHSARNRTAPRKEDSLVPSDSKATRGNLGQGLRISTKASLCIDVQIQTCSVFCMLVEVCLCLLCGPISWHMSVRSPVLRGFSVCLRPVSCYFSTFVSNPRGSN